LFQIEEEGEGEGEGSEDVISTYPFGILGGELSELQGFRRETSCISAPGYFARLAVLANQVLLTSLGRLLSRLRAPGLVLGFRPFVCGIAPMHAALCVAFLALLLALFRVRSVPQGWGEPALHSQFG
jgi:hypothetical protein